MAMRVALVAAGIVLSGMGAAHATAITTLASFTGTTGTTTGSNPQGKLIIDASGNLFGTTVGGGKVTGGLGAGTVFELAKGASNYTFSTLTTFSNLNNLGSTPFGGLYADATGNLYGTTAYGGPSSSGNAFKLTKTGNSYTLSSIATFSSGTTGSSPTGELIADGQGNLYGVTNHGGTTGYGTVFELVKSGSTYTNRTLTTLDARPTPLGDQPFGGLIADKDGNLFGTTNDGGVNGYGTVFELVKNGSGYTQVALVSFNHTNGSRPYAAVTMDANGNLFGTTTYGGTYNNGTAFELIKGSTGYTLSTLASFGAGTSGTVPDGALLEDYDGNLFGTTLTGGTNGLGTVYELARGGAGYTLSTLYSFDTTHGATPYAGLVADANGNLFGTTSAGGAGNKGTVFEITNSGFVATAALAVPEPGSLALLAGSMVAAVARRRRQVA